MTETKPAQLTLERAIELADQITAAKPDFVYNNPGSHGGCFYTREAADARTAAGHYVAAGSSESGCLVGEIIKAAGLMTEQIANSSEEVGTLWRDGLLAAQPDAVRYLRRLQARQDDGMAWRECFLEAATRLAEDGMKDGA